MSELIISLSEAKELLLNICQKTSDVSEVRRIIAKYPELLNQVSIRLNEHGVTALTAAARTNHVEIVKELLSHNDIDVNRGTNYRLTALHEASSKGYINVVQVLLSHPKIDVNSKTQEGSTPLYDASFYGHVAVVRELLSQRDIDVTAKNFYGRSASDVCCGALQYLFPEANESNRRIIRDLLQSYRSEKVDTAAGKPSNIAQTSVAIREIPSPTIVVPSSQPHSLQIESNLAVKGDQGAPSNPDQGESICDRLPPLLQAYYQRLRLLCVEDDLTQAISSKLTSKIAAVKIQKVKIKKSYEKALTSLRSSSSSSSSLQPLETADFAELRAFTLRELNSHLAESEEVQEEFIEGVIHLIDEVSSMTVSSAKPSSEANATAVAEGKQETSQRDDVESPAGRLSEKTSPLPAGKATHVFLTHTWRKDEEGRDNHKRVRRINDALKRRGIVTWFDSDRMSGAVRQAMTDALYSTGCVLIFITREYETKINSKDESDNCYYEFNVAANHRDLVNRRIPIVMEKSMLDPLHWADGRLKAEVGDKLFFDLSSDEEEVVETVCDQIARRVRQLTGNVVG